MLRIIQQTGGSTLVESTDGGRLQRVIIPSEMVTDGAVSPAALEYGVAYGLPWEELWTSRVTPAAIAQELRKRGIWTLDDLRKQPMAAVAAMQSAYGLDVATLTAAAERFEKQGE